MDTWLTFHDYRNSIKTDGGTQTVSLTANGFKVKVKGDPDWQIRRVVLPGKASKESYSIRTTNRHRWTRRVFSGARVMVCSGTRQIDSVTSG